MLALVVTANPRTHTSVKNYFTLEDALIACNAKDYDEIVININLSVTVKKKLQIFFGRLRKIPSKISFTKKVDLTVLQTIDIPNFQIFSKDLVTKLLETNTPLCQIFEDLYTDVYAKLY